MRVKLDIVVTCTDRKSLPVSPERQLRSVLKLDLPARVHEWKTRLSAASEAIPLRNLYQGESWAQVARLEASAVRAGFEPSVFVASAGLGLRRLSERSPSYAATFSPGSPDSTRGDVAAQQAWWDALNRESERLDEIAESAIPTLMVLSQRYARVLAPTIARASAHSDILVVGGSSDIEGTNRLPSDRGLRKALGGTLNSLNIRMGVAWMDMLQAPRLDSAIARSEWAAWADRARQSEQFSRTQMTDEGVRTYVRQLRGRFPDVSKTQALRALRDDGFACEQTRFSGLFNKAKEDDQ